MECPKCGTWNPEDKIRCWRCNTELPRPPEPRRSRQPSSQTWIWVVAVLFFVLTMLIQCGVLRIGDAGDRAGYWAAPSALPFHPDQVDGPGRAASRSVRLCGEYASALRISTGHSTVSPVLWVSIG